MLLGWGWDAALLMGGITYISSSGIIAKVLDDLGNTGNAETPVVLSVLVTEDLVMAFYLPLMAGLLIGGQPWEIGLEIAIAVSAVVAALANGDIPYSTGQVITVDGGLNIARL